MRTRSYLTQNRPLAGISRSRARPTPPSRRIRLRAASESCDISGFAFSRSEKARVPITVILTRGSRYSQGATDERGYFSAQDDRIWAFISSEARTPKNNCGGPLAESTGNEVNRLVSSVQRHRSAAGEAVSGFTVRLGLSCTDDAPR